MSLLFRYQAFTLINTLKVSDVLCDFRELNTFSWVSPRPLTTWQARQVHAVTQALFQMYENFREGPAPEAVHRYLQLLE